MFIVAQRTLNAVEYKLTLEQAGPPKGGVWFFSYKNALHHKTSVKLMAFNSEETLLSNKPIWDEIELLVFTQHHSKVEKWTFFAKKIIFEI